MTRGWLGSLVIAAAFGAVAWHAAGAVLVSDRRQELADRWAGLRRCLLGDGLVAGRPPSERWRYLRIAAAGDSAWPARCAPYADALDALREAPSLRDELAQAPAALQVITEPDGGGPVLDALAAALDALDLPQPSVPPDAPLPPEASEPLLRASQLSPLAKGVASEDVAVVLDVAGGRSARMLIGTTDAVRLCRFDDGEARWLEGDCRELGWARGEGFALAPFEPGGVDLVRQSDARGRLQLFDASSGQRLWRSPTGGGRALVLDGSIRAIGAERREEGALAEEHRLVVLRPGKAPEVRRLGLPDGAATLLFGDATLWWSTLYHDARPVRDELFLQGHDTSRARRIGDLPVGSRITGHCTSGARTAILFSDGTKQRLALRADGEMLLVDPGPAGDTTLSCHDGVAVLLGSNGERLVERRCRSEGCARSDSKPLAGLAASLAAWTALGDGVLLVWRHADGTLRLRTGPAHALADGPDRLLLDDARHGGLDATELRLTSSDGLALLLLQEAGGALHAVRIASDGAQPIRVR